MKNIFQKIFAYYYGISSILTIFFMFCVGFIVAFVKTFLSLISQFNFANLIATIVLGLLSALLSFVSIRFWIPGQFELIKEICNDRETFLSIFKGLLITILFINSITFIISLIICISTGSPTPLLSSIKGLIGGFVVSLPIYPVLNFAIGKKLK